MENEKKEIKTYGDLVEEYVNCIIKIDLAKKEELDRKYGKGTINKSIYLLTELKNQSSKLCINSDISIVSYTRDSMSISNIDWRIEQIKKLKAELDKEIEE